MVIIDNTPLNVMLHAHIILIHTYIHIPYAYPYIYIISQRFPGVERLLSDLGAALSTVEGGLKPYYLSTENRAVGEYGVGGGSKNGRI